MPSAILGISAYYHDSAAALLIDGEVIAAAHEERFTRKKHDASFPTHAIRYVMSESSIPIRDLSAIAFYDKPYLKFERLLETYHAFAPAGFVSFLSAMPVWVKEKLFMKRVLWQELESIQGEGFSSKPPLIFPEHHLSHAASAFFPSPFQEAAIVTIDGVGEWATTTIAHGKGNDITILDELLFPHSLGLLYSAFTYYCGFKVNSGEYKLMGLAPYGHGRTGQVEKFVALTYDHLVDLRADGSLFLNMEYFDYATGLRMCKEDKWEALFGVPPRKPESEISQVYMDLALAVQRVTEEAVMRLSRTAKEKTGASNIVLAGGVALNCVANGKLLKSGIFDNVWVQPAAGDAGGALGAAYAAQYIWDRDRIKREADGKTDSMKGAYLGPEFTNQDVKRLMRKYNAVSEYVDDYPALCRKVAEILAGGDIVGWFQGRMEWGPRALGNRSILGDPRNPAMQKRMNLKIKYREGFRPFAPSILMEEVAEYFEIDRPAPYMQFVVPLCSHHRKTVPEDYESLPLFERLYHLRSDVTAVTHVDFSARIQTVHRETNERYWQLIRAFKELTGCPLVVNTSFNVRGEPIVCTPEEAYQCFMRTEMDYLVINDFLFAKSLQPAWAEKDNWRTRYALD